MAFSVPGVCELNGVLPNTAAAELSSGPVQHLSLQPISKRAGGQGRGTYRLVGLYPNWEGGKKFDSSLNNK